MSTVSQYWVGGKLIIGLILQTRKRRLRLSNLCKVSQTECVRLWAQGKEPRHRSGAPSTLQDHIWIQQVKVR